MKDKDKTNDVIGQKQPKAKQNGDDGAKNPKTRRGAQREYDTIIRLCRAELQGTLEDGFNWPKIRVSFAKHHERILELRALYKTLPK